MTHLYLLEILQLFYAHLNAREVKRALIQMVTSNCLALQMRLAREWWMPYTLGWQASAVPKSPAA